MEVDEENNFFARYYFSTNPNSVQLHEFCGDGGFVVIPDDKTELVNGNRIVRIGIGKNKWTDVRGMKADVIADLIPKKKDIRISFDALVGDYPDNLNNLEVSTLKKYAFSNVFGHLSAVKVQNLCSALAFRYFINNL